MSNPSSSQDVADALAQLQPDTPLWNLRAARVDVKNFLQGSDAALFTPVGQSSLSVADRHLVGLRVGVTTQDAAIAARHRAALQSLGAADAQIAAVESGSFDGLPASLAAALRFSDKITREPREASPDDTADLKASGLSASDIVTLAQLISYMSFQVRLLAGLRALA